MLMEAACEVLAAAEVVVVRRPALVGELPDEKMVAVGDVEEPTMLPALELAGLGCPLFRDAAGVVAGVVMLAVGRRVGLRGWLLSFGRGPDDRVGVVVALVLSLAPVALEAAIPLWAVHRAVEKIPEGLLA